MPRKSDNIPINNEKLDRRVKLSSDDKALIVDEYKTGLISINGLARKYNVSKRTIQFTLFPERAERARQQYKERRKDGRYYDREKHTQAMKTHREYKKKLNDEGLLNSNDSK